MTILVTLVPLLFALLLGYWLKITVLPEKVINTSLAWLTYFILAIIGFGIGSLDNLNEKLVTAGMQAFVFFCTISVLPVLILSVTGYYLSSAKKQKNREKKINTTIRFGVFCRCLQNIGRRFYWWCYWFVFQ